MRVPVPGLIICLLIAASSTSRAFPLEESVVCNVMAFGAAADTLVNDQQAFQTAIDVCANRGGGTVYVPPGDYRIGPIYLKDNIELHLEAGANLFASRENSLYRQARGHRPALIAAIGCRNVALTGRGVVDGRSQHVWTKEDSTDLFIEWETRNAEKYGVPLTRAYHVPPSYYLVNFMDCEDVRVEDVSLVNSQFWTLNFLFCERVRVRGCYVWSDLELGINADGIDIDGCRDVTVSDCIVITGDDAICLKTSRVDGRVEDCENITVMNCVTTSTSAALKIGTGSWGDFRNIVFTGCSVNNTNRALGIFARYGGTVENVIFSNITVYCDRKHYNWWGDGDLLTFVILKEREDIPLASIRDVLVENITAHVQGTSVIRGFEGFGESRNIENVTLRNIILHMHPEDTPDKRADHAFDIERVDGIRVEDVTVYWDGDPEPLWRSALSVRNARNVFIDGFCGRQAHLDAEDAAVTLENVRHADIRDCVAAEGTSVFLEVAGEAEDIFITGTNLARVQRPVYIRAGVNDREVVTEFNRGQAGSQ